MYPRRFVRYFTLSLLLGGLSLLVGCSSSEPTYPVKGQVSLDNKPMTEGTISFEADPPDGNPPVSADIKDGEYVVKVTPGKKIVRRR